MAGGVVDGQSVSASVSNAAWISKNGDDTTSSNLGFTSSNPASGSSITNAQREWNAHASVLGIPINQVFNYAWTWASNLIGLSTDTVIARIQAIIAACKSTATASSILFRDVNANAQINNLIESFATTVTAAGTTTLTVASAYLQQFTGTTTQSLVLPDATTLAIGQQFSILNRSTGIVTVKTNGGATLTTVSGGTQTIVTVTSIGSTAGVWDIAASSSSSGGGGGGSLQWLESDNSALPDVETAGIPIRIYRFQSALGQSLYAQVKVPTGYIAGNPIKLKTEFYSPDSSGTALISTIATLIRQGTDTVASVTNQRTSSNTAVTLSGATINIPQALTLDLTDTTGHINAVAVSAGDLILVQLTRGTDTGASDLKVPVYGAEVTIT